MAETRAHVGHTTTRWGRWWDRHPRLLRVLAAIALASGPVYFAWRLGWSLEGANPVVGALLVLCELYGFWSLATLAVFSWRIDPPIRPAATPGRAVDVYVCTYDEPEEVVRATLTGCRAMHYPHTTYLLDDGRRGSMRALAHELGAVWLTRPDNSHAKAGNVNHALRQTDGELVFVLDADHVPLPDALDALVGYFDDDHLAVVQTPHDFYNHDSAQHYEVGRHEQSVFFEVVCPGKDRHGAAFWCGSAALIRRAALVDVGGVATETIAEDFHTTIKMQQRGWTTRYHAETVVQGLAPHNLAAYLLQRDRWARGNLAVFTTPESPLRARHLPAAVRLSYFASLMAYLAGPVRMLSLVVLALAVWIGALPMRADVWSMLAVWLPFTTLVLVAGSALCRGHMKVKDAFHFEVLTAQIHLRALRCIVSPGRAKFRVTPKEGVDPGGLLVLRQLKLVTVLTAVLCAGLMIRFVELLAGASVLADLPAAAGWAVPLIAAVECRRLLRTLRHMAARSQRRASYRFPCRLPATADVVDDVVAGVVTDISPRGARLVTDVRIPEGSTTWLCVALPDAFGASREWMLLASVTGSSGEGDRVGHGLSFVDLDDEARQAVIEYCYVVRTAQRLRGDAPLARDVTAPARSTSTGMLAEASAFSS